MTDSSIIISETNDPLLISPNQGATFYGSVKQELEAEIDSEVDEKQVEQFELKEISKNSFSLSITFLLQFFITTITIISTGKLGVVQLGGVSIANVTFQVSCCILIGMATSLDTLCPQAFGLKKYKNVWLFYAQCVVISFLVSIPLITIWCSSQKWLSLIVDDAEIIKYASTYLKIMSFSIPGYVFFECGKKILQAQEDFDTGRKLLFIGVPVNIILNFSLVAKIGFIGAPISAVITYNLIGFLVTLKTTTTPVFNEYKNCEIREYFTGWSTIINLAIPGIIMLEAEFFAFEVLTVLSAKFGNTALAAQSVAASLQSLIFQIPFSFGVAISNRLAYQIGRNDLVKCKIITKLALVKMATTLFLINCSIFLFLGKRLTLMFTSDPEVSKIATKILKIIAFNQLYDVFNIVSAGILRSQGRQRIGGFLNIFSYYIIGLPLGIILAFNTELNIFGFWIGLGVGILILAILETYYVIKSDWVSIINSSKQLHGHIDIL
ncbi:hypothetical protein ACO0SA_000514 [Hanseniaspora valbyensis]